MNEIRKSIYAILKSDIRTKRVQVFKAKDKIEYHIYKSRLPNKLVLPRPVLWAVIVCKAKHIIKNIRQGLEVTGTRYTGDALRKYLNSTKKINRQYYNLRFK